MDIKAGSGASYFDSGIFEIRVESPLVIQEKQAKPIEHELLEMCRRQAELLGLDPISIQRVKFQQSHYDYDEYVVSVSGIQSHEIIFALGDLFFYGRFAAPSDLEYYKRKVQYRKDKIRLRGYW